MSRRRGTLRNLAAAWALFAAVPAVAQLAGRSDTALAARLLSVHNQERARVGAPPLAWDDGLAAQATAYASAIGALGRFEHSPRAARPGQGESLWRGSRGAYSPDAMVANWAEEKRLFRPGLFPAVSMTGNWLDIGHYSQMIWRGTTRVGCGLHHGTQWDTLVCRYSPKGNIDGQQVP